MKRILSIILCFASIALVIRCSNDDDAREHDKKIMVFWVLGLLFSGELENGSCPFPPVTHVLEPGTYTINLAEGETYWFDPTVRQKNFIDYYKFDVYENPGQETRLYAAYCNIEYVSEAINYSGTAGSNKELYLLLERNSVLSRFNICFFKAAAGPGSFTFTIPSGKAVP